MIVVGFNPWKVWMILFCFFIFWFLQWTPNLQNESLVIFLYKEIQLLVSKDKFLFNFTFTFLFNSFMNFQDSSMLINYKLSLTFTQSGNFFFLSNSLAFLCCYYFQGFLCFKFHSLSFLLFTFNSLLPLFIHFFHSFLFYHHFYSFFCSYFSFFIFMHSFFYFFVPYSIFIPIYFSFFFLYFFIFFTHLFFIPFSFLYFSFHFFFFVLSDWKLLNLKIFIWPILKLTIALSVIFFIYASGRQSFRNISMT